MNQNEETNKFYIKEDRRTQPKEYFELIYNEISENLNCQSVCDVGCATGDFLWYLQDKMADRNISLTGIDNFDELREEAKRRLPNCKFINGDIETLDGINKAESYDVVVMSGVLYLFDEFERIIQNLINMTNKGGKVLVFSTFNENGYRVITTYSKEGQQGKIVTFSMIEIAQWLNRIGYKYEFIPFHLKSFVEKNQDNPLRSYTVPLADGTNGIINGLDIWHRFYLLKIDLSKNSCR